MNRSMVAETIRLGGDPGDAVWQWLWLRGPHGATFSWSQTRKQPAGYVGLEHLRRIVAEHRDEAPGFVPRLRSAARAALSSTDADLVRRGIQVLAVVGDTGDLPTIAALADDPDDAVRADARACAFELRKPGREAAG